MNTKQMAAFTSGLIIVLNIWGGQKSGLLKNATKEMANVQICLNVLKLGEKRYVLTEKESPRALRMRTIGGILQGVFSECTYNVPISIAHIIFISSDILKEIGSLNEQPGPNANHHTISDQSSMKSGHQDLPVSNAPRTAMLPNMTAVQTCSPIGTTTENAWGLNNHLQSQMGITQANPAVFAVAGYDDRRYVNYNDVASQAWVPPSVKGGQFEMFTDEFMDDAPPMYQDEMISADMLSLWSDASAAFRSVHPRHYRYAIIIKSRLVGRNGTRTLPT